MALNQTDMDIEELRSFMPNVVEPLDFDDFWAQTIAESKKLSSPLSKTPVQSPVEAFDVFDMSFSGFGGEMVKAWGIFPKGARNLPTIVEFCGYGGGRGMPWEHLEWPSAGFSFIMMDTRGQGSVWGSGGDTPDPHGSGSAVPGFMSKGIEDKSEYYYRRLFTDAVLLVDEVSGLAEVNPSQIAVTGGSQGGGISLACAALNPAVKTVMPDVPFLCNFERSIRLTPREPFTEITRYLSVHRSRQAQVLDVLSYFDGVNFARRIVQPALLSVGLMDEVVLPSTVFAAYNHLASADKEIAVFAFNGHEGGGMQHWATKVQWAWSKLV
jgi:Acetyl esterase (deacetylase)